MSTRNPDEKQKQEQPKKPEDQNVKDPKRQQKSQQTPCRSNGERSKDADPACPTPPMFSP